MDLECSCGDFLKSNYNLVAEKKGYLTATVSMPIAKLPEEQQQVSDIGYLLLVCEVSLAPVPHGSPFQCFTFFFFF